MTDSAKHKREGDRLPAHIEVEGAADRDVYLNGERLDQTDGGLNHVELDHDLGDKTAQVTVGYDDRLSVMVEVFEFPTPDPVETVGLDRVGDAPRPTFRGEAAGEEMLVELVERGE